MDVNPLGNIIKVKEGILTTAFTPTENIQIGHFPIAEILIFSRLPMFTVIILFLLYIFDFPCSKDVFFYIKLSPFTMFKFSFF